MKKILKTIIVIIFCYFPIATLAEIKPIIEGSNDAKVKIIIYNLDYYYSNIISRASNTMSQCRNEKFKVKKTGTDG